ncbi:MAG TPA: hypothetical protein VGQ73_03570 [Gemmatimonadales bacterium]|nr:hypothetical protein [Gemmatimonadales bacterium]
MLRILVSRLVCTTLIVMLSGGGSGLPVLDGLIYHTRGRTAVDSRSHYEATGSCHSDVCSIRSTASQARFTPALVPAGSIVSAPEIWLFDRVAPAPFSNSPFGQPLSRAPPRFG